MCSTCTVKKRFDLDESLSSIIGLGKLKKDIKALAHSIQLDHLRGLPEQLPLHMIFRGNPGTGKTSIARLMAQFLKAVGYLPTDNLIEVQRSDLVAEYVGQTAIKTKAVISKARGGVLFVDEAYRLSSSEGKDFGPEAVEELMSVMNDRDLVIILAGYPPHMEQFVKLNPGIPRRIRYTFDFADYSPSELAEITLRYITKRGFQAEGENLPEYIRNFIPPETLRRANGGVAEYIFRGAKRSLDDRTPPGTKSPSILLTQEDLKRGCQAVQM